MQRILKFSPSVLLLTLIAGTLVFSGCGSKPSNTQLVTNVQKKIGSDAALQGQTIAVAANDGTVTLSGTVSGPAPRELAANDAAKVDGVHKVINNLAVGNPTAAAAPANGNSATEGAAPNMPPPPPPAPSQAAAPATIVIPAGTRIRVQLRQTLSSKNSQTGQPFSGTLASPVRVNNRTVIRAGAQARGTVVEAKSHGPV